jgi:hypothetical protein
MKRFYQFEFHRRLRWFFMVVSQCGRVGEHESRAAWQFFLRDSLVLPAARVTLSNL